MPTTDTFKFRKLTRNILLYVRKLGVGEATSIQVTKNLRSKPHRDKNNKGPSWIFGLGDWTEGGETFVQDHTGTEEYELQEDIRDIGPKGKVLHGFKRDIHTLQKFDGTKIHCTVPFEGTRYAIILYAIKSRADEELGRAAVEGRPVADEPGRHRPPAGRRSRPSKCPRRGAAGCRAGTTCDGPLSQAHRARCTVRCGYIEKHEITQAQSRLAGHRKETWEERGVSEAQMGGTVPFLSSRCAR